MRVESGVTQCGRASQGSDAGQHLTPHLWLPSLFTASTNACSLASLMPFSPMDTTSMWICPREGEERGRGRGKRGSGRAQLKVK